MTSFDADVTSFDANVTSFDAVGKVTWYGGKMRNFVATIKDRIMAVQLDKPRRPINVVLRSFARQAVQQLESDFRTQHIYPYEIYPGYKQVNERRRMKAMAGSGDWYATGQGINSFQYEVMSATEGNETIRIEFLDHLRFVDMGTAGGKKIETIQRQRKAKHNKRYVAIWDSRGGDQHRPSIMREARHIEARMTNYLQDFYGREVQAVVYKTFAGMKAIDLNV